MRLHLHSGDAEEVMKRLDEGLLDFGLLLGPLHRDKYDYLDLGMRDTYGLLMPADCPLAERGSVTLDDLKQVPLIFPNQPYSGHQRLDWFGADFGALHIVATYNLLTNATFLVERGLGYAFCIDGLVDAQNARGLAFRPVEPALTLDACIAAKRHRTLSPAAKLFFGTPAQGSGPVAGPRCAKPRNASKADTRSSTRAATSAKWSEHPNQ